MKRQIVQIDEEKCNGCGICIPNCHEGALQIIDGKARLISDLMCDGLGACLGHCPEGALEIIEREAAPYDEIAVIKDIIPKGKNTMIAHLQHLKEHSETTYLKQAVNWLEENRNNLPFDLDEVKFKVHTMQKPQTHESGGGCGCMGSQEMSFDKKEASQEITEVQSELRQWPVQLHLVSKNAQYFRNADLLLAADCVAFSMGNFHQKFLKGKGLAIACPKLDSNMEVYVEKLIGMIDEAKVNTITVMIMEVPCCGGLLQLAKTALQQATRKVPLKVIIVSVQGEVIKEEWIRL